MRANRFLLVLLCGSGFFNASPARASVASAAAGSIQVSLTAATVYGIATDGTAPVQGGFDNQGYAFSSVLLGNAINSQGVPFQIGHAGVADGVSNSSIALPGVQSTSLQFLAAAVNGNQTSQSFVVTYADGSTSNFTQSISDWARPQGYPGETVAAAMSYRIGPAGVKQYTAVDVFSYSLTLNSAKRVLSVQLPANRNVVVLAMTVIPASNDGSLTAVDLSGTWSFTPLSEPATTISVPGGGWYKQGFTTVSEADYQRSITIPNSGSPQTTTIEFGAVNYQADLYINNVLVGTNVTAFLPSVFDISSYVTPGSTYTMRVHVKGKAAMMPAGYSIVPDAAQWQVAQTQGIFRSAFLKVYPQVYISDELVRTSVANESLTYDVWVKNKSTVSQQVVVSSGLSSWNNSAWQYPSIADQPVTVAANSTVKVTIGPIAWNLGPASYWWPNVPYVSGYNAQLHNLNLSLKQNSVVAQTVTVRFGFRDIVQASNGTSTYYYLNGIRVNLRGDSMQSQDYDGINYGGGLGDAMGTFPGFLPGPAGWSKAVDNYQKLNYNVVRLCQMPSTPFMVDVADEMGLMTIQESAIRGGSDQDYYNSNGNFVNHVSQIVSRDKNHPSIMKWSISNEADAYNHAPATSAIQTNWYDAAKAIDPTRPINMDVAYNPYNDMTFSDLTAMLHYGQGFGVFTNEVFARPDRPFGEGEFIWPIDGTSQGFTLFSTSMYAMRRQDASDLRPYALLSAWASLIPGAESASFTLEQGGHSLYDDTTAPNPLTNPQFMRLQAAFNPVLVADRDYWLANNNSNAQGSWPAIIPALQAGSSVTRTLEIFNDTFSGTQITVVWEVHSNSATGPLVASGSFQTSVNLGFMGTQTITFTAPTTLGSVFLVLKAQKSGVTMFTESNEEFAILSATSGAVYSLTSANSGKVLDVYAGSTSNGAAVIQWPYVGVADQKWQIVSTGNGYFNIVNQNSGKCLDVNSVSTANGATVDQWTCVAGAPNEEFQLVASGSGWQLVAAHSGKCIDDYAFSTATGATVDQWTCTGGTNEQWIPTQR